MPAAAMFLALFLFDVFYLLSHEMYKNCRQGQGGYPFVHADM